MNYFLKGKPVSESSRPGGNLYIEASSFRLES